MVDDERPSDTAADVTGAISASAVAMARFAVAHTGSLAAGETLVRETLVAAARAFHTDPAVLGTAALFAALRKRCAQHAEQRRRQGAEPRDDGVRPALAEVRPTEREALLLRYVAGLGFRDVAAASGIDEAAARQRVSRGLSALCRGAGGASPAEVLPGTEVGARRRAVEEHLADVLEGIASDDIVDFVADDDVSRDLVHDAERLLDVLRGIEASHRIDVAELERAVSSATAEPSPVAAGARSAAGEPSSVADAPSPAAAGAPSPVAADAPSPVAAAAARAEPTAAPATRPRAGAGAAPVPAAPGVGPKSRGRIAAVLGVAAALAVGWLVTRSGNDAGHYSDAAWSGKVTEIARGFGGGAGLERCSPDRAVCSRVEQGDDVPAGSTLRTDGQTRAIVALKDGTELVLDRGSELALDGQYPRRARLERGGVVADVAALGSSRARFDVPLGFVETESSKLSLVATSSRVSAQVVRGSVRIVDSTERGIAVHSGEEGRLAPGAPPEVYPMARLGSALDWTERAFATATGGEPSLSGLGELRAKKPGEERERKGAVVLASHSTKVRIVGNVARTEIEEEFTSNAGDVLEGIFRFPLPPDAQIERLALDVDGHQEEGAFVDRERAAAIWRGAIVNAGAPKPAQEEIVWVPGPWRDPALLEWQRGGSFELRIYPIPKHGSRRVTLAYTQTIAPSGDVRRYVYPLPRDPSGSTRVGRFQLDVQVRGHDARRGVLARGYEMRQETLPEGAQSLSFAAQAFSPSGDLSLEYALPNPDQELTAWAYQPGPDETASERAALATLATPEPLAPGGRAPHVTADAAYRVGDAYVAIALHPKLPRSEDAVLRELAIVVDSSRSMFGERYVRATELAARIVSEMDRGDHVTVLACDSTCRELPSGLSAPGPELAGRTREFLRGITPEGGSDVGGAIRRGRDALRAAPSGAARVVYIGDGTPTIGAVNPAFVRREIESAVPRTVGTVTAVALGADSDVATLGTLAEAGGGVVIGYTPGQSVAEAAYAVLGATYGTTLADPEVELPDGLVEVAPSRLGTIPAGGESLLVARMTRPVVDGTLRLRGTVGGAPFEQRYPLRIEATTAKGNAFVARLWAAAKLAELEKLPDVTSRRRAVELSGRFHVASRYTSLLVLESAAMFQAFGLDRSSGVALWTGEDDASSTTADGEVAVADPDEGGRTNDKAKGETEADVGGPLDGKTGALGDLGTQGGARGASAGAGAAYEATAKPSAAAPAPAPRVAAKRAMGASEPDYPGAQPDTFAPPPPTMPLQRLPQSDPIDLAGRDDERGRGPLVQRDPPRFGRRWVPMRKVWDRVGHVVVPAPTSSSADAIASAERDAAANDLRRDAVKRLYTLYFLSGNVDRAGEVAERWSAKDPLDADALTARADVAAARGERDLAIRILGSVVDVRPGDHKAQWRLARLHRWAGRPELGCRHSLAVAQIRLTDAKLVAEAVRCSRDLGHTDVASDLLSAADDATRRATEALLARTPADPSLLSGDLRVEATWDGGEDIDVSMLPSDGNRVSWLGAPTKAVITARDVLSTSHEGLALRGAAPGDYLVEVTRPVGHSGVVRGTLDVTAAGERRSVPFVLDGERLRVALVKITTKSRLVPL